MDHLRTVRRRTSTTTGLDAAPPKYRVLQSILATRSTDPSAVPSRVDWLTRNEVAPVTSRNPTASAARSWMGRPERPFRRLPSVAHARRHKGARPCQTSSILIRRHGSGSEPREVVDGAVDAQIVDRPLEGEVPTLGDSRRTDDGSCPGGEKSLDIRKATSGTIETTVRGLGRAVERRVRSPQSPAGRDVGVPLQPGALAGGSQTKVEKSVVVRPAPFGSISNSMLGMFAMPPPGIVLLSPVVNTRNPTWVRTDTGLPTKSVSLPNEIREFPSPTRIWRLPSPDGGGTGPPRRVALRSADGVAENHSPLRIL